MQITCLKLDLGRSPENIPEAVADLLLNDTGIVIRGVKATGDLSKPGFTWTMPHESVTFIDKPYEAAFLTLAGRAIELFFYHQKMGVQKEPASEPAPVMPHWMN